LRHVRQCCPDSRIIRRGNGFQALCCNNLDSPPGVSFWKAPGALPQRSR
jgi:hypothetical protein